MHVPIGIAVTHYCYNDSPEYLINKKDTLLVGITVTHPSYDQADGSVLVALKLALVSDLVSAISNPISYFFICFCPACLHVFFS